jgi:hypothetical protein
MTKKEWIKGALFLICLIWIAYSWSYPGKVAKSECEYVRSAYLAVLDREPDRQGFDAFCRALVSGAISKKGILEQLMNSDEFHLLK